MLFIFALYIVISSLFIFLVYFTFTILFKMSNISTTTTRAMLFDMDGTLLGTLFFSCSSVCARVADILKSP